MRLLRVDNLESVEFVGSDVPPYAILSHTWEEEEVTFQGMADESTRQHKRGFNKITRAAMLAAAEGLEYLWVDTCCIDKSSSAELSEAINSMFRWYEKAHVCYVYLSDWAPPVDPYVDIPVGLKSCRWFSRGWTLQELIAPVNAKFYDRDWNFRGTKQELVANLSSITGIKASVLSRQTPLPYVTAAAKMSWASNRHTTREEDVAYCLLGIFGVNMPLLYGEGGQKAFTRLQEEIIKSVCDLSIFAWTNDPPIDGRGGSPFDGVITWSPKYFQRCGDIVRWPDTRFHADFSVTNRGIRLKTGLDASPRNDAQGWEQILPIDCMKEGEEGCLGIMLRKCGSDHFVRHQGHVLKMIPWASGHRYAPRTIYLICNPVQLALVAPPRVDGGMPHWVDKPERLLTQNRISAVVIRVPVGFRTFSANPASNFDSHQCVFFSTDRHQVGWFAITVQGMIVISGESIPVSCFFSSYNWTRSDPYKSCVIGDPSLMPASVKSQLRAELRRAEADQLPWCLEDPGYLQIPAQDSVSYETRDGKTVRISYKFTTEMLPDICQNVTHVLEFFVE